MSASDEESPNYKVEVTVIFDVYANSKKVTKQLVAEFFSARKGSDMVNFYGQIVQKSYNKQSVIISPIK